MISVLGIPFDNNSSFMRERALAPTIIRKAFHSESSNYFTEFGRDINDMTAMVAAKLFKEILDLLLRSE